MGAIAAFFGKLYSNGVEQELRGGLNWLGVITPFNDANGAPLGWTLSGAQGPQGVPGSSVSSNNLPYVLNSTTANVNAASNTLVDVGTLTASITVTLPASPASGDWVEVCAGPTASVWPVAVARNGNNIEGAAADAVLDVDFMNKKFVYSPANGWIVVR